MPDEQIRALLEHGEEEGCLNLSEFCELTRELDMGDDIGPDPGEGPSVEIRATSVSGDITIRTKGRSPR